MNTIKINLRKVLQGGAGIQALALLGAGVAGGVMVATPAAAQDAATASSDGSESDTEIVVTGSRIARPELQSPNPIVAVTSEQIENAGGNSVTDVLIRNPALINSQGTARSAGSNTALGLGEVGVNLLDLRNLGSNRTLVLVNGRRHVAGIPDTAAVDISSIQEDLIDRVDVLTGGASAVYGADGVSGVVNFVLKRDFDGVSARFQNGISERGDGAQNLVSIVAGKNFAGGRGNITLGYEYDRQARVDSRARDYLGDPNKYFVIVGDPTDSPDSPSRPDRKPTNNLRWADSAPDGAIDLDMDFTPDFTGSGLVYDLGTYLPNSSGSTQGGSSTPRAGYYGDVIPQTERNAFNALGSFEFSNAARLSFEGKYVRVDAFSIGQPSYDFYTVLAPDNYYLAQRFGAGAASPDGAFMSRDNFDLGQRAEDNRRETWRGVLALDGAISDHARYELSYTYGRTDVRTLSTNNRIKDRYFAALDAVSDGRGGVTCRINLPGQTLIDPINYAGVDIDGVTESGQPYSFKPGECVPLNLLGEGVASQAAIDFVTVDNVSTARIQQHVVSGSVSGDFGALFELPGGPVGFAFGGEYRKEKSRFDSDTYLANANLRDSALVAPSGGSFDVKEAFGEVRVPLLKDLSFAHELSLGAAARISDYSSIGSTSTYKFDAVYSPIRDVTFRGTYSKAVRAPNISELYGPRTGTNLFITDPCDITQLTSGTSYRQANCTTVLSGLGLTPAQIAGFSPTLDAEASTTRPGYVSGNPNLQEETARTWTAGVVLQPSFVPRLSLTFDWYNIRIKGAVNTATAEELAQLCVDQPTTSNIYCPNITRDPTTGFITNYTLRPENVAQFETAGFDATLNYRMPFAGGSLSTNIVVGYLDKLQFVPTVGADIDVDLREQYAPRWQTNANVNFTTGPLTLGYSLSWFDKTRRYTTETLTGNPDITDPKYFFYKARWEHDVRFAVEANDKFTFYGGVNNIGDQRPDFTFDYPVSAMGRFFYAGVKVKTGKLF